MKVLVLEINSRKRQRLLVASSLNKSRSFTDDRPSARDEQTLSEREGNNWIHNCDDAVATAGEIALLVLKSQSKRVKIQLQQN